MKRNITNPIYNNRSKRLSYRGSCFWSRNNIAYRSRDYPINPSKSLGMRICLKIK